MVGVLSNGRDLKKNNILTPGMVKLNSPASMMAFENLVPVAFLWFL